MREIKMEKLLNKLRENRIFLIPLFLLLILIFSMWDSNYYFGGDFIFPLKPQDNIQRVMSLWSEQDGGNSYFNYVLFLWEGFFYLLNRINIPPYISMKILIVALYVLGFVCTYFLYLLLFRDTKYADKKAGFLAALIFTLNPVAVLIVVGTIPLYGFPVLFLFLIKYLDTKNIFYSIPFAFFLNLSFFPDFPQAKLFIVFIIASLFLLILYSLLRGLKIKSLILPLTFLMLMTFMLNAFLLFPFLIDSMGGAGLYQHFTQNVIVYDANADLNTATLSFIPRFFNANLVDKYSSLGHFLGNNFFDLWTFFLQFLAILSPFFIIKKKEKRVIYVLLIAFIFFVFIAKGINPPFGEVYKWMIYHVPIVKLFRTTANVIIGGAIFYSILLSITVYYLSKKWKPFFGLFLVVHLVIFYPVYTGVKLENVYDLTLHQKGITLPSEYLAMGNLLDNGKDGKILVLPPSDGYIGKNWGYNGQSLIAWLTHKSLFFNKNSKTEYLDSSSAQELCSFTSLNNIRYFLREKDARGINVKKEIAYPGSEIVENQYFSLQETNDSCFLPHFYIPEDTIFLTGNTSSISDLSYLPIYKKSSAVFINDDFSVRTEVEKKTEEQSLSNVDYTVLEALNTFDVSLPQEFYMPLILGEDRLIDKIVYPYVRISPDSSFYPFVLWKEDRLLTNGKLRDRQLLDLQLFLASKRIKEINRWGIVNKPWQSMQKRFQKIMKQAIETAATSEKSRDNLELVYEYLQGFRKNLREIIKISPSWDKEKINSWEGVFDTLETETKNRYIADDYNNLAYNFVIPHTGVFQGYILLNRGKPFSDDGTKMQIELNNDEIATYSAKEINGKNLLSLGALNLNTSKNSIKVHITNKQNLVNSLEWKTIGQTQSVALESGSFIFSPNLEKVELQKAYDNPVIYQEIKTWEPGSIYLLRLRHKEQNGATLHLQIKEKKQVYDKDTEAWVIREPISVDENLNTKVESDEFKLLLTADKNSVGASIYISGINGVVRVEDVQLEKIIFPRILLVNSKDQNPAVESPKVSFIKESPTKYRVTINELKKPMVLIFSEGFDKGWKIYSKGKEIGGNNHFMINGYANAWYLDTTGDQELIIEYWPQRLFYLGWIISFATFLLFCIYALFKYLRKGKEIYEKN